MTVATGGPNKLLPKLLTLGDICEATLPLLPDKLFDEENRERIRKCALLFSPSLKTDCLFFECVLNTPESIGDFHFQFSLKPELLNSLRESFSENHWHESYRRSELVHFFERWAREEFFHQIETSKIILEFDTGSAQAWPPIPNVFISLFNSDKSPNELIEKAYLLLKNDTLHEKTIEILHACETESVRINHVGFMLGRSESPLRISCGNKKKPVTLETALAYLKKIGHPCLDEHLVSLLNKFHPFIDCVSLEIDIGKTLVPKIGINFMIESNELPEIKESWDSFLNFLASERLISCENQRELISWLGVRKEPFYSLIDSSDSPGQLLTGVIDQVLLFRNINHLKLNYSPGLAVQMKAYLTNFTSRHSV